MTERTSISSTDVHQDRGTDLKMTAQVKQWDSEFGRYSTLHIEIAEHKTCYFLRQDAAPLIAKLIACLEAAQQDLLADKRGNEYPRPDEGSSMHSGCGVATMKAIDLPE
jgi:hypothetical protein